jgi:CDP-paratose 2-epimerase
VRVLVTGGAGFVGSHLAIAVKARWPSADVVAMDNLYRRGSELNVPRLQSNDVQFHRGDVRDAGTFPAGPFDFLVECSAEPSVLAGVEDSPDYVIHTNLIGMYRCLEAARRWNAGVLFLSTSRVYPMATLERHAFVEEATRFSWADGGTPGISARGVSEDLDMRGARSLYGYTKYAAELLVDEYRAAFGIRSVINRCGVIAGPWQFGKVDQGVAALWVLAHHFGRPLTYIGYGGLGKQVRDFLHVQDLCDLVVEQIHDFDRWDGWLGNVGGGPANTASLRELTALCRQAVGREVAIGADPGNRPGDLRIFIADCARLFERTAWRPHRDVARIIGDTAEWVRQHSTVLQAL